MESIVGQTVSHYEFLEKLGAGGMGEIYKARDSRLNRIVAVKVLAAGGTRDPERRRRFVQEARAASALNHPNIITIHDILPEGDTQYMVMEHVTGETLQQLIGGGGLPARQALQIAMQMANALAAAHTAGIIHRDLKPANVMVTHSGLVKVLDFGLAKLMDPTARMRAPVDDSGRTEDPLTLTAAPLTVEGSLMGTVNYMSPEQAEGLKVNSRSDIFSFGAVLYEMVTGRRAFDGDSPVSTLSAVLRDEVRPIREIAPEVPPELSDLIARCLRKNQGDRWQSMNEVAAALRTLAVRLDSGVLLTPELTPVGDTPPEVASSASPSRTNRLALIGGICVVLGTFAIAGAWWQTHLRGAIAPPNPPQAAAATSVEPAPQQAPPPAAPSEPEAKDDAPPTIPSAAAPPPSNPVVPLVNKGKTPIPPPQVTTTSPSQPQSGARPEATAADTPVPHPPAPPQIVSVKLGDGLPFRIALLEDVPMDADVGQVLRFRVLDDVQSGDVVVIAKGAIVTGSLAALGGKRKFFGERSKVRFRLMSVASVDDSKIAVRATPAPKTEGDETRPFETPKSTKDKGAIAASGTEYVAYVQGDQTVNIHK